MSVFEITSDAGDLGVRRITVGNTERYCANFCGLLDWGVRLSGVAIDDTSNDSIATSGELSHDHMSATWYVEAANTEEEFDFELTVTTTDGQTLTYTVHYMVETTS